MVNQHIRSDLSIPAEHVFLKRPNLAKKIKDYFSQSMINKPAITVLGLVVVGGAGKTTLARAYGKSLANASVVWEINAETRSSIIASFTKLAHAFAQTKESKDELTDITGIQNADEMTKKIIDFVATHLQISPNWLLIFDNVESFSDLDNFFPRDTNRYGSGNIIITTHNQSSGTCGYLNDNSTINIDTLNTGEMLTLFTKMTYNTEAYVFSREKEKKLIQFLSNIPPCPLDVSIASYYIKNSHIGCEAYFERMNENEGDMKNLRASLLKDSNEYARTRYNIVTLSIKELIDTDPEFKNLLMSLSLVSGENIPKTIFDSYKDPALIDRFIFALKKYAFIMDGASSKHNKEKTFSIHRSIQKIIRNFLAMP